MGERQGPFDFAVWSHPSDNERVSLLVKRTPDVSQVVMGFDGEVGRQFVARRRVTFCANHRNSSKREIISN